MTKEEIILRVSEKIRLIRAEVGYNQDRMAEIIGLSKKTLVQIEKGRAKANWATVVTVCALFRETETVQFLFGSEPLEVLETIARNGINYSKEKTLGGKIWWREIVKDKQFILQQNILSSHYRIIDQNFYRVFSSFDEQAARDCFAELTKNNNEDYPK